MVQYTPKLTFGPEVADWQERLNPERMRSGRAARAQMLMRKYGIVGVEMEAAGIYGVAAEFGVEALAICTVSDDITSGAALTSAERQSSFDEMIRLGLDTAIGAA